MSSSKSSLAWRGKRLLVSAASLTDETQPISDEVWKEIGSIKEMVGDKFDDMTIYRVLRENRMDTNTAVIELLNQVDSVRDKGRPKRICVDSAHVNMTSNRHLDRGTQHCVDDVPAVASKRGLGRQKKTRVRLMGDQRPPTMPFNEYVQRKRWC